MCVFPNKQHIARNGGARRTCIVPVHKSNARSLFAFHSLNIAGLDEKMVMLNGVERQSEARDRTGRLRDDTPAHLLAMHLQQPHFGPSAAVTASPEVHHFGSLSRKINNEHRSYQQRLSTFRPMHGQPSDLVRECLEEGLGGPTYETIDPHHHLSRYLTLSHPHNRRTPRRDLALVSRC